MPNKLMMLCSLLFASSAFCLLQITDRPKETVVEINSAFRKAKMSSYKYFGTEKEEYGSGLLLYLYDLAKTIIETAPADQKDFYFLDVGAGMGGFVDGLAEYLAHQKLPSSVQAHVIGLTAQTDTPYVKERLSDNCTKYLIGDSNAEYFDNVIEKLKGHGLDIKNNIDLAASKLMFTHLIDPLGTLIQIHDNLRPNKGFIFVDHFYVIASLGKINSELYGTTTAPLNSEVSLVSIYDILPLTNTQWIIPRSVYIESGGAGLLMRRIENTKLNIPMSYGPLERRKGYSSGDWPRSSYIGDDITPKPLKKPYAEPVHYSKLLWGSSNSVDMYKWLLNHSKEFSAKTSQWQSIYAGETTIETHRP